MKRSRRRPLLAHAHLLLVLPEAQKVFSRQAQLALRGHVPEGSV